MRDDYERFTGILSKTGRKSETAQGEGKHLKILEVLRTLFREKGADLVSKRRKQKIGEQDLIIHAIHEAGHAVVGHVIGRLIDEISIVPNQKFGYMGYCRFATFTESIHDHNQWVTSSGNPELLTIQYAGSIAVEIYCQTQGWDDERWRGSERADIIFIDDWCAETFPSKKRRASAKKNCAEQARTILTRSWTAVDMLATDLLQLGWTPGYEAHETIREALGETDEDWRLTAAKSED